MNFIYKMIATVFFSGCIRYMPGTIGSAITIVLIPIILIQNFILSISIFFTLFLIGWYVASKYSAEIGVSDPKEVVIDEFVAQFMVWEVMNRLNKCFLPMYSNYVVIIMGFVLFRFFDIWKPFPINYFDKKLKNGFGIMFDDILAGLYSIIVFVVIANLNILR